MKNRYCGFIIVEGFRWDLYRAKETDSVSLQEELLDLIQATKAIPNPMLFSEGDFYMAFATDLPANETADIEPAVGNHTGRLAIYEAKSHSLISWTAKDLPTAKKADWVQYA